MRAALTLTRRSNRLTLRAWVVIAEFRSEWDEQLTIFEVKIVNNGKVPASGHSEVHSEVIRGPFPSFPLPDKPPQSSMEFSLGPNAEGRLAHRLLKLDKVDREELTKCGEIGCGPTAAVNSFTYLQTAFPRVYTTPLVPAGQDVMVADALADLMGCCGAGTSIENFIRGKRTYVESKDAGVTKYGAEISGKWNGTDRPDFVHENATATDLLAFIERELRAGEDVEISIANAGVGHFLTLTGVTFEDETRQRGQLAFVDPNGGTRGTTTFRIDANGDIRTTYILGAQIAFVRHAVSESPVPEPSTLIVLASGVIVVASWRAHRVTRVRSAGAGHSGR